MISIKFESAALPADTFQILKMDGEEEISHLFRFELQLVSRDPNIDFNAVLQANAHIAIETQDNTRYLHGMLSEFEQFGEWQSGVYEYRAVLVPRLWMMSQSTQNQIFQEQTVPEIIESELSSIQKKDSFIDSESSSIQQKGGHPLVMTGLSVDDYEIYIIKDDIDKKREYVVQYKETDLNFISRLMEHEGIYYYFEHDENREKLVITNAMATEEIAGDSYAEFLTEAATARYDRNVVYKLSRSQKQIPGSVIVTDFNYREPSVPMQSDNYTVLEQGIGFVTEFGAHFKEPAEGLALAKIRAEEFRCRENVYAGESNIAAFACGGLYSLGQHFRADYNQTYLITKVEHHASQELESWGNVGNTNYHNVFNCIPSELRYRPQRLTPKPKLFGIMNGTIDSEQDLGRADLDEYGRYKVKMPFDMNGAAPGMASRRIRMAQPYGGAGDDGGGIGMSFPLVKGTEVIWTCIDGDIDRPIITGVVPNPLQPSVTNTQNATSNVIKTSSGITMGFHDGLGRGAGQNTTGGGAAGGLAAQQQYQSIGSFSQDSMDVNYVSDSAPLDDNSHPVEGSLQQTLQQQQQMSDDLNLGGSRARSMRDYRFTGTGKNFAIVVPNYEEDGNLDDSKDSYFRMGMPSDKEADLSSKVSFNKPGITSYTDGDYVSIVKGQTYTHHAANSSTISEGTSYSYGIARKLEYSMSNTFSSTIGISGSANTGLAVGTNVGVSVDLQLGAQFSFGVGAAFSFTDDTNVEVSKDKKFDINERFWAKIDPPESDEPGSLEDIMENKVPLLAAGIALGSTAASAAISIIAETSADAEGTDVLNGFAEAHAGAVYLAGTGLSIAAVAYALKNSSETDEPLVELDMWKGGPVIVGGTAKKPYAKLQAQHETKEVQVEIRATKEFDKKTEAAYIDLINKPDLATINIKAAGTAESGIIDIVGGSAAEKGEIKLKVGKSSITIKDTGIEFDAPYYEFKVGGIKKVVVKEKMWVDLALNVTKDAKLGAGCDISGTPKLKIGELQGTPTGPDGADSR